MALSKFFSPDEPTLLAQIQHVISADRLAGYLADVGGDAEKAVLLYTWNAALASAFLPVIGLVEVALRNALYERLCLRFTVDFYDDPAFLAIDNVNLKPAIDRAKRHISNSGKTVTPPRMIAQLMFGFWVKLLRPAYSRSLWPLFRPAFAKYTRRPTIAGALDPLVAFRNRIDNHEAVYDREPAVMYDRINNDC
jgi:hypothetical protein